MFFIDSGIHTSRGQHFLRRPEPTDRRNRLPCRLSPVAPTVGDSGFEAVGVGSGGGS